MRARDIFETRTRFDANRALVTYFQEKPYNPLDDGLAAEYWETFVHHYLSAENRVRMARFLGKPIDEIGPEDYYDLPPAAKQQFAEWTLQMPQNASAYYQHYEPSATPAWMLLHPVTGKLLPRNTPLVHFSDHVEQIKAQGFRFGVPDINYIAVTREHSPFDAPGSPGQRISHGEPGYNYAYMADGSVDFDARVKQGWLAGYGAGVLLFHSSGLLVHHEGDREDQVVFWGPSANTRNGVVIQRDGDRWMSDRGNKDKSLNRLVRRLVRPGA